MYGIIVGCGRLGSSLALSFSEEGHDIVVVDSNPESFRRLGTGFNGTTVQGTGIDEDVLKRAGIEKADFVFAVTSSDTVNLMVAQVAKTIFGVKRVIARIYEPQKEGLYKDLGVEAVCMTDIGVREMRDALHLDGLEKRMSLGAGSFDIVTFKVKPCLDGKRCKDVAIPGKFRIVALTREKETVIAGDEDSLHNGDLATAVLRIDVRDFVVDLIGLGEGKQ